MWTAPAQVSEYKLRLDNSDKVAVSVSSAIGPRTHTAAILGGLALALAIGWVGGWSSHLLWQSGTLRPNSSSFTLAPHEHQRALTPNAAKTVKPNSKPSRFSRSVDLTQSIAQGSSILKKTEPVSDWGRPSSPAPETRPTTIGGWTVREVVRGVATPRRAAGVLESCTRGSCAGFREDRIHRTLG